ncbi:MAG: NAD(P)H-dependent oxidoreductase [Burkholderiales bacterium]|nr:NAD(P)H-dependent oxidoreductase [Burkholderiales bacterium]
MSRILVVYFSRSGNTRRLATEIAEACGADLEELVPVGSREGVRGYLRASFEALLGLSPALQPLQHRLQDYETVIIGTPIWVWNIAGPVRSFVRAHRAALQQVTLALFCTCGRSGRHKVIEDLHRLCGRAPVAALALTVGEIASRGYDARMLRFLRDLKRRRTSPMVAPAAVPA